MNTLTIANTIIRRDAQGRYCLNDLHQAAGGLNHQRPSKWMANSSTQAQLDVLNLEAGIPVTNFESSEQEFLPSDEKLEARIRASNSVRGHGITATYVVKELVYSYAMWINPAFHIKVIRTFDAAMNGAHVLPHQQNEIYWFARRPRWEFIRRLALEGWPYRAIAKMFDPRLGQGSIANSVQAMVVRGLINPQALAKAQHGVSRKAAERRVIGWGMVTPQLSLGF